MLIFDELKKNDPQLRLVAVMLAAGLCILLAGLWWVQVVSAREYQNHLETQSYRTVRIPAVRGKILDRNGRVLAENRPRYNLSLYLDDLRKPVRRRLCADCASRRAPLKSNHRRAGEKTGPSADQGRTQAVRVHDRAIASSSTSRRVTAWPASWSRRSASSWASR